MTYLGSKNKIINKILPMLSRLSIGKDWVEPFVGSCSVISKVNGKRTGNDSNKYLISLLKAVKQGWIPPTKVTEEMYHNVKNNKDTFSDELVGFVGFPCSFGGKWFNGYAKNKKKDNYAQRGSNSLVKISKKIKDVELICGDYSDMEISNSSFIYCDPPYRNTTGYSCDFDHYKFWEWCRDRHNRGNLVVVSEYSAPDDFEVILEINTKTTLNKNISSPRTEKIFRYKK